MNSNSSEACSASASALKSCHTRFKRLLCLCSIHVASVLQMTHMLVVHGGVMKSKVMDRVHQVASYWSAIVHDYEHGGLNNDFLVKTAHPLAIRYNDSSPWENHHLAASSEVLYQPEYCFCPVSMPACSQCMQCGTLLCCDAIYASAVLCSALPCCPFPVLLCAMQRHALLFATPKPCFAT